MFIVTDYAALRVLVFAALSAAQPTDYQMNLQSNLDYSKCQGPQESFRIIGSSNDQNWEFSDIFGKAQMLS